MNVRTILSSFLHFGVMEVLVFLTVKEVLISRFDFYIVLSFSSPIFGTDVFYMLWQKKEDGINRVDEQIEKQ